MSAPVEHRSLIHSKLRLNAEVTANLAEKKFYKTGFADLVLSGEFLLFIQPPSHRKVFISGANPKKFFMTVIINIAK
jgi:hypothetical protein